MAARRGARCARILQRLPGAVRRRAPFAGASDGPRLDDGRRADRPGGCRAGRDRTERAARAAGASRPRPGRTRIRRRGRPDRQHDAQRAGRGVVPALRHRPDQRRLQGDARFELAADAALRRAAPERGRLDRGLRAHAAGTRRRCASGSRFPSATASDLRPRPSRRTTATPRNSPTATLRLRSRAGRCRARRSSGRDARPRGGGLDRRRQPRAARPARAPAPRADAPADARDDGDARDAAHRRRQRPHQRGMRFHIDTRSVATGTAAAASTSRTASRPPPAGSGAGRGAPARRSRTRSATSRPSARRRPRR